MRKLSSFVPVSTSHERASLRPYRAGLVFGFVNALTWLIALQTPLVLLLERLGATPFQVGLAHAWVFLLLPLQIVSTITLPILGYKAQVMIGWSARSFFLLVPFAFAIAAPANPEPWMVIAVITAVFFFCLFRAYGSPAVIPWLYTWIPENIRGRYFATDQSVISVCGVLTLLVTAGLFKFLPEYTAFTICFSIAIVGSVLSVVTLARWPTVPKPRATSLGEIIARAPRLCLDPGPFRRYLILTIVWWTMMSAFGPFAAFFLKREAGLSSDMILLFVSAQFLGGATGAMLTRGLIDNHGVRPFFQISLLMLAVLAGFWLFIALGFDGLIPWVPLAYFWFGLSGPPWWTAHLKYLPQLCSEDERALAVAVQSSVTGLMAGVSPILWGLFMKTPDGSMNTGHFAIYFAVVIVAMLILVAAFSRIREEYPDRDMLFAPGVSIRFVRFIASITPFVEPSRKVEGKNDDTDESRG